MSLSAILGLISILGNAVIRILESTGNLKKEVGDTLRTLFTFFEPGAPKGPAFAQSLNPQKIIAAAHAEISAINENKAA